MVDLVSSENLSFVYLFKIFVFPTPESPTMTTFSFKKSNQNFWLEAVMT
jgi:hypothetical protein